ncbi:aldehyde dehydrogenase iron-sulfur subunit [Mobilicoccus pelagius]|uniref:Putative oxidoreductase iron-sulfur subunit n=1 Tax=Mobilicoccus pelagius NBRC 104925 TaxID=1089455 RepID=H5URI8_9MICO|nr:aldehyde dehydrogenase iron-sulfur subunit [Mobilicoccus pelagius]GAB48346.1 putative oxidoreductase iron-sulfur subunit [Mobilicoccus pelagius NBRC 104925]
MTHETTSPATVKIILDVDGESRTVAVEPRTTLLDTLRERLGEYAPKKGCDHGQCGSCTVILDGRRHLSCLTLAVQHDGAEVTTAAGLGRDEADGLHPVQRAFVERDGLQCGYCTPGQVCAAVGALDEIAQGRPSHVTADLTGPVEATEEEVRERLSGNLCRCGAYPNIVDAVRQAAGYEVPDRIVQARELLQELQAACPDAGSSPADAEAEKAAAEKKEKGA